ncbi:MAG: DUF3047 domain-containing protein [Nitrospirota bacterium]
MPRSVLVPAVPAVFSLLILVGSPAFGANDLLVVGAFSQAPEGSLPPGWKPEIFKKGKKAKQTTYEVVRDGETTVLRADSVGTASGLEHEVSVDLQEYPVLRWRWKVDNVVVAGDPRRKDKDDYAARVYVTFAFDADKASFGERLRYRTFRAVSGKLPFAAIAYIWASRTPVHTVTASPHMGGILNLIAVENGDARVGQWVEEERNVYEDYRRAFGKEPPLVSGVAVMTDTDNTQERATAYYGDLVFAKE